jgi:DNA-binding CsgD family transcriptional regulator
VVLGRCADLFGRGLLQVLQEDEQINVIARDLDLHALERTVAQRAPVIAVIEDGLVPRRQLKTLAKSASTIVLAHEPSVHRRATLEASGAICLPANSTASAVLLAVRMAAGSVVEPLTPRELEVLVHIRTGKTSKEIAAVMFIGVETVRTYTTTIRRKLGVKSKRDLIQGPTEAADSQ